MSTLLKVNSEVPVCNKKAVTLTVDKQDIIINADLNEETCFNVLTDLNCLEEKYKNGEIKESINVIINSSSGNLRSALSIALAFNCSCLDFQTIIDGYASGTSFLVFLAGKDRLMTVGSEIQLYDNGFFDNDIITYDKFESTIGSIENYVLLMKMYIANKTKMNYEEIERLMNDKHSTIGYNKALEKEIITGELIKLDKSNCYIRG